jgi:NAD+ diphosphatase
MATAAETVLAYSGGFIDRAASQRNDQGWVDATLAEASTRLIPVWRDQCVVSGEPAVPVILPAAEAAAVLDAAAEVVLLGLDDHGGVFAADLTAHVDGEEVIEARWFTRAELAEHAAAAGRLGREDSIDRYLLRSWLEDTS